MSSIFDNMPNFQAYRDQRNANNAPPDTKSVYDNRSPFSNPVTYSPSDHQDPGLVYGGGQTPGSPSGWNGILDNPLTHGLGTVYNYGKGVLSGFGNALSGNNQAQPPGGMADKLHDTANQFLHPTQFLQHNWNAFKNIPTAIWEGYTNPTEATRKWEHGIQNDANTIPDTIPFGDVAKGTLKYGVGALNDPLLLAPVDKALQAGKWASDAAGATPYISKAFNAVTSPLVNNKAANSIKDIYGSLFKKGFGTSADTMPTMNGLQGNMAADQYAIQNKMAELAKSHGLTPDQLAEVPHVIDGRVSTDPQVNQAARELSDTLNGGFQSVHGKVHGTDAELRNSFTGKAPSLQDLFSGKSGNPIRSGSVENYYPRRFNNTPEEISAALDSANHANQTAKGLSTNGTFNQKRTFDTLQEAIDHGLEPEMNPYVAIGQRLAETSKAVHTDNAIKQLLYSGVVGKEAGDGLTESIVKPFNSHIIDVPGKESGDTTSLMQKYFMKPQDQSAIMRSIDPQGSKTAAENVLDKIAKPYDVATRIYKQLALYNPLVHGHNIGYNGMYLGGADASQVAETMANLLKGRSDPWYQKALAAGAVSSDTKGAGSFSEALRGSVTPEDKTLMQKIGGGIDYVRHGSLWDADKAMRTSLFRQAKEGGLSSGKDIQGTNNATSPVTTSIHDMGTTNKTNEISQQAQNELENFSTAMANKYGEKWRPYDLTEAEDKNLSDLYQNWLDAKKTASSNGEMAVSSEPAQAEPTIADEFSQAAEGGATDAEAAAKANKYMINYNDTTPFESAVMKRIFPFYSWMKGNLPLQAQQWITNTPKQVLGEKVIDAFSQALSGNESRDGKLDTGKVLDDGSHVMVDPYIPSADITKMLRDGPIPFLFNRSNPFLKEVADQSANKAYSPVPLTTANGKDYLNKTEIRPPGADAGYDTRSTIAHTLKTVNPFSGGGVGGNVDTTSLINQLFGLKTKDVPGKTIEERTIPWLGAFTSRYNPDKEAMSKKYQDRQDQIDRNSFNKSQGIPVSKADKRKAYRKVK
jgi:hypothetical protein